MNTSITNLKLSNILVKDKIMLAIQLTTCVQCTQKFMSPEVVIENKNDENPDIK